MSAVLLLLALTAAVPVEERNVQAAVQALAEACKGADNLSNAMNSYCTLPGIQGMINHPVDEEYKGLNLFDEGY